MFRSMVLAVALGFVVSCSGEAPVDRGPDGGLTDEGPRDGASDASDAGLNDDGGPTEDAGSTDDGGPSEDGGSTEDGGLLDDGGLADDGGGEVAEPRPLRFLVIGDMGKGNTSQFAVGSAMAVACENLGGCDFVVSVGDNLYPSGASSVTDPIFQTHFEEPYAGLEIPFYMSLGNHDYGADGMGLEFDRGDVQVAYSNYSPRWRMPAPFYTLSEGPVDFFALDTNSIFVTEFSFSLTKAVLDKFIARAAAQQEAFTVWKTQATRPWKIAYGHHPYLSNGRHGNAGTYDKVPFLGRTIKKFVEDHICGQVDVFLAGHDHNNQDLVKTCGTEFIVAGASASTTKLEGRNASHFQTDDSGFVMMEATDDELVVMFFNTDAAEIHRRVITR